MNGTAPTNLIAPLGNAGFRSIWAASTLSLMAFWMTEVACAWQMRLMTDADPLMVASVYTVLQLPILLLVIPAGVLTDLVDRRRVMIWTHAWLAISLCVLFWLVLSGTVTPFLLLLALPLVSIGQAIRMPGISTLIPDLVRRDEIPAAVSLNSIAQNGSRIAGPAIAGALIALLGVPAVLGLGAAIMIVIVALFVQLRYTAEYVPGAVTWARFTGAVTEGLRFTASTRWKRNILIRLGSFFACSAAVPALMAVRFEDSQTYGAMYACFGAGSLLGLLVIARLGHEELDRRLSNGLFVCGLCIVMFGMTREPLPGAILLTAVGASWIFCSNSIMVAAQTQLTRGMRGRGLSFVYAVGTGCLSGGGLLWGSVARASNSTVALITAGCCLLLLLALTHGLRISAPVGELAGSSRDV